MEQRLGSPRSTKPAPMRDWLILGLAGAILFAMGLSAELFVEHLVTKQVDAVVQKITTKFSIPIIIGQREVQRASLLLTDIAIGVGQPVVIDRIEISLSFNPFSQGFLRPSRVDVGRVFVKEQVARDGRLNWFLEWRNILSHRNKESSAVSISKSAFIPPEIHLATGKIILADGDDIHTVISGIEATVQLEQRRLIYEVDQLTIAPWIEETGIVGRLVSFENGDIQGMLRQRSKIMDKAEWMATCEKKKNAKDVVCDVDAEHLPSSLVKPFTKLLTQRPGFHGSVRATSVNNGPIVMSVDADVTGIVATHKTLSIEPIGPFSVGSKFSMMIDTKEKRIFAKDMKLAFAPERTNERSVGLSIDLDLTKTTGQGVGSLAGDLHFAMARTRCDDVLNAMPAGFGPDIQGFSLKGDLSLEAFINIRDGDIDFRWGQTLVDCTVDKVPASYSSEYLSGPFELERTLRDGRTIRIPVDPARPDYTRLKDIPSAVTAAFVTSEDAGFWQHRGIEPSAIIQALERNAHEGRAAVGGSTITMQTVKNLFLSRDKNISRKAQEIFLAWYLEQAIGKQRILEIYLNIVEFGPDLYGLGGASRKFFGVTPDRLNLKQAIYLASLLPAPIPRFQYFCRGGLTPNYSRLVDTLLHRMLALGRISEDAYATASSIPLQFQSDSDDPHCTKKSGAANDATPEDEVEETTDE